MRGVLCGFARCAGLYWLSTAPDERQKGYATCMQYFRLKRAQELEYKVATLTESSAGYKLYKKLGWQECGVVKELKIL